MRQAADRVSVSFDVCMSRPSTPSGICLGLLTSESRYVRYRNVPPISFSASKRRMMIGSSPSKYSWAVARYFNVASPEGPAPTMATFMALALFLVGQSERKSSRSRGKVQWLRREPVIPYVLAVLARLSSWGEASEHKGMNNSCQSECTSQHIRRTGIEHRIALLLLTHLFTGRIALAARIIGCQP